MSSSSVLTLNDFSVTYEVDPPVEAVRNVSLTLKRGEILGLAGESGCGKTTLAYGIQRLLKPPAVITSGSVMFHDESGDDIDITRLDAGSLRAFR
jgi:peptide/nickel transport system ATP-binding protein